MGALADIFRYVSDNPDVTIDQVASGVSQSNSGVRYHLDRHRDTLFLVDVRRDDARLVAHFTVKPGAKLPKPRQPEPKQNIILNQNAYAPRGEFKSRHWSEWSGPQRAFVRDRRNGFLDYLDGLNAQE